MHPLIWLVSRATVVLGALYAAAWWLLLWPLGIAIAVLVACAGIGAIVLSRGLVLVPLLSLAGTEVVMLVISAQPLPQYDASAPPYSGIGFSVLHGFAQSSIGLNAVALLCLSVASLGLVVQPSRIGDRKGPVRRVTSGVERLIVDPVRRWIAAGTITDND